MLRIGKVISNGEINYRVVGVDSGMYILEPVDTYEAPRYLTVEQIKLEFGIDAKAVLPRTGWTPASVAAGRAAGMTSPWQRLREAFMASAGPEVEAAEEEALAHWIQTGNHLADISRGGRYRPRRFTGA